MNFKQRMILHNLNLDYNTHMISYEKQTDRTLNMIMNKFVEKYKDVFDTHNFILEYQDNIFGILTYYILKNIQGVYPFNLKVYGKIKKTKHLFYNKKDIITKWRAKHRKNTIFINCFNPLYYVDFSEKDFNDLSKSISIIDKFTPEQLNHLCCFFNLWNKDNKELLNPLNGMIISTINEIFNKISNGNALPKVFYNKYCNPIPDIIIYKLNGDESDFPEYDRILKEEKNYIVVYECPKEKEQFIIDNLNFFINSRNAAIKGYNLNISEEKINRLKEQREEYIGENIYS